MLISSGTCVRRCRRPHRQAGQQVICTGMITSLDELHLTGSRHSGSSSSNASVQKYSPKQGTRAAQARAESCA